MNHVHKTSLVVAAVVVALLALAFFLTTNTLVNSSPEPHSPQIFLNDEPIASEATYYVSVENDVVYTSEDFASQEEAWPHCQSVAFAPENMWRQVICVYGGAELYNDVFVAG